MSHPVADNSAIRASLMLLAATVAALLVANSGLAGLYKSTLDWQVGAVVGPIDLEDSIKNWIKNALMAVFFVFVGLEIKAEFKEGALASRTRAMLPFAGAAGGMLAPAAIFLVVTAGVPALARGWAIPSATDIAFAIGVVGLLGRHVSPSLRAFLLAVAVIDDLGAILVIAIFYTGALQPWALVAMAFFVMVLAAMNIRRVAALWPYMLAGAFLWLFTLQSGINPTLAGVVTALFVPLRAGEGSPLHRLADALRTPVNFIIMPVFAFANAGVPLLGLGLGDLLQPLTLGIALGLILGKPVGITLAVWIATRLRVAELPRGAQWSQIVGISCLAGIGFTMSLFIGALAFREEALLNQVRLGVLSGSLVSALLGVGLLLAAGEARKVVVLEKAK
jgi:NhaA family Na+:H+ antiporter